MSVSGQRLVRRVASRVPMNSWQVFFQLTFLLCGLSSLAPLRVKQTRC
jgi:hypothetical protein